MRNYHQDLIEKPFAAHPQMLGLSVACLRAGYGSRSSRGGGDNDYEDIQGIAVIPVTGLLTRNGVGSCYSDVRAAVARAMSDPKIAAIVLNIDSMGGECTDLFPVSDYIYSQRGRKPISAFCDPAFSGAYCIASAADRTYISVSGGVGSIGIAFAHLDMSGAAEQQGVKVTLIHAGQRKVWGNQFESLAPEAHAELQTEADRLRGMLCECVARNRGVSPSRIAATEAGIFYAPAAIPLLADRVASLTEVIDDLMDECGINGRGQYSPIAREKRRLHRLRADTRIENDLERRKRLLRELRGN